MCEELEQIIILTCDSIPNQQFWDGEDWTTDLESAKRYPGINGGVQAMLAIPQEKVTHRVVVYDYIRYKWVHYGRWDGESELPEELKQELQQALENT